MEKRFTIPLDRDHSLTMKLQMFDEDDEVNLDKMLTIDTANIHAEIATIPVLLNRFGFLLADANNAAETAKLQMDITEAQLADAFRNKALDSGEKQPSNEKVGEHVTKNPAYIVKKQLYLKRIKERDYMNSLYWALKSKDQKLQQLMGTIEAADMAESIINARFKQFNYVDLHILKTKNS